MKINFVLPSIGVSGGINVIYKYVDLLTSRGHDVYVYKEYQASNMHRYELNFINKIHQIYCTSKALIERKRWQHKEDRFVYKLTDKSVRNADVIIATAWTTAYEVSKLSIEKGEKFYFIQDYEVWDNAYWVKKTYQLPLQKIVISTYINNCLKRDLGIGPFPIVFNGLDIDIYHHVDVYRDEGIINFLMLNHTLSKKGVKNGIKVFENIKKEYPNAKFRMFGNCEKNNLPEYVEYYQNPSQRKLVELYSMSDIFVFPSIEEGWGLTPLEAMACGCIVVGTNTGFALDLGLNEINMMVSPVNDIGKMISNINKVLNDKELAEKIRNNGLKTIKSLKWAESVIKLESILTSENG